LSLNCNFRQVIHTDDRQVIHIDDREVIHIDGRQVIHIDERQRNRVLKSSETSNTTAQCFDFSAQSHLQTVTQQLSLHVTLQGIPQ